MNMLLTKLTPAETLLITQGEDTTLKDALRYTMMDLLLKRVLTITDVERESPHSGNIVTSKYIVAGENFKQYPALAHELVFLIPFRENPAMHMLFKNCVKIGFENAWLRPCFRESSPRHS
jgi:hypothetical protein